MLLGTGLLQSELSWQIFPTSTNIFGIAVDDADQMVDVRSVGNIRLTIMCVLSQTHVSHGRFDGQPLDGYLSQLGNLCSNVATSNRRDAPAPLAATISPAHGNDIAMLRPFLPRITSLTRLGVPSNGPLE